MLNAVFSMNFIIKLYNVIVFDSFLPPEISNLSNLISLVVRHFTFQGFDFLNLSFHFSQSFFLSLKIDELFPSCFQNMTRLTNLILDNMRERNPEPIPFPTQFCNMIYLQKFTSEDNNFSGF